MVIFRELLQAAYTPTLLDLLADAKDSTSDAKDSLRNNNASTLAPARNTRARWEHLFEEELAMVAELISSEMAAGEWLHPGDALVERRDVGADIAAAVMEALAEETAAELMGMGHDCAVHTARRRCWC
uniref:DUF4378 domain-containing protein n=1 Tax=Arundo donax TaxID=35708 RepID=A0A0A8YRS0_ARUDO